MTAIGELVVKIVPDAKEFRRDTKRQLKAIGEEAGRDYNDGFVSAVDKDGGRVSRSTAKSMAAGAAGAKVAGAAAGSKFVDGVDDAVARGSGRVTKRTTSLFDGFLGGLAFNAPMFRGVASTFGLMGGQALYAGAAVAGLGAALKTVAVGAVGLGVGAAAFTALSVASLKVAGTYQMQAAAMNVLMDSTEKGGQMMKDLVNFSKTTPFELEGTIDAAKRLMAMGFAAEEVLPTLTRIGNATAALGTGTEGLSRLALVMGQIRSKGKLMTQDVNQLAEQGIPLWDILATKLGKTRGEIMGLTEEGLIPAEVALGALNEYMDMKFSGTMQAQAETLLGTFENLKETLKLGFAERLQDDLPKIASLVRDLFPAFQTLSVRIAEALGPSLVGYLDAAKPAIASFLDSLGGFLVDLMDTWTPTMATLSANLSDAFTNARPGIQVLSDAFASMVGLIGGALPAIASGFSEIMVTVQDLGAALGSLGVPDAISGLMDFLTAGPETSNGFDGLRNIAVMFMELSVSMQSLFATMALGISQLLSAFGKDDAANNLETWANQTIANIGKVEARIARAKLDPQVRVQLEDAESQLIIFASKLESIDEDVLIEAGVNLKGVQSGNLADLKSLLGLPDEVLIAAGLEPGQTQAQVKTMIDYIESLSPEVRATINADTAAVNAAIAAAKAETQKEWILALQGDPSGVLAAAAQANAAVEGLTAQVMVYDATTGTATLAANTDQALLEVAAAEGRIFEYDDTTGTATLLSDDQASAKLDALGIKLAGYAGTKYTSDIDANATLADMAFREAEQKGNQWDATTSTSVLDANPTPFSDKLAGANSGLTTFGQQNPLATLGANSNPFDGEIGDANSSLGSFGRRKETATLDVDSSRVQSGVQGALSSVASWAGRTFTAILATVTGNAGGGPIGLASGGQVPVAVSNGEYVLGPRTVNRIGMGNALALNAGIPIKPGLVRGAGTSTSDSIRGTLPPGSFVIKESSVRRLGSGYLRSLATGGSVSGQSGTVKAGNTYNWTVTAKTEPTEETMLTLLRRADAIYGV